MKKQKNFDMGARDWSKFAWNVIIDGLPTPTDLIDHELRNKFNGEIYLSEDGELWSQYRSKAGIGPDELDPDDIVDAYCDLFGDGENVERSRKVFEQAIEDEDIPQKPREAVEQALNMYMGMKNYESIIKNEHSSEDTVSYDFLLEPVDDKPYMSLNEEGVDSLRSGEKQVGIGEAVFFFLNTVDKNFHDSVIDEVDDPELHINTYLEDDTLVLELYDNGPGIGKDDARRIFKPEFGNSTGLPVTNYIIEEYGGELDLYDEKGGFGLKARFGLEDL